MDVFFRKISLTNVYIYIYLSICLYIYIYIVQSILHACPKLIQNLPKQLRARFHLKVKSKTQWALVAAWCFFHISKAAPRIRLSRRQTKELRRDFPNLHPLWRCHRSGEWHARPDQTPKGQMRARAPQILPCHQDTTQHKLLPSRRSLQIHGLEVHVPRPPRMWRCETCELH